MSYNLMFQKAIDLQNNGALNEAEDIYLQLLQLTPENADLWNLLGLIAQSKNDYHRAVDCFLKAIKYAPTPFFMHFFNLALTYKALAAFHEADDAFKRCLELNPQCKEAWLYYGIMQAHQDEIAEATKSFCKALELDNNYTDARAYLCFYTKDFDHLYQTAHEDPTNFTAQLLSGMASSVVSEKESYFLSALEIMPYHSEALLELAKLKCSQKSYRDALTLYFKVLNYDKNNIEGILGVADMYLALEEFSKAETYYLKSFEIRRDIAGAYLNYGISLYKQHRLSEALEAYRQAVILDPDSPEICYNLALILKETEEYEEALGLMFSAHQKNPQNEAFNVNLMETLTELFHHNAELALKIAENWQKIEPNNVFSKRIFAGLSGSSDLQSEKEYAEKLFDVFAETYDRTLTRLNPQIIRTFAQLNPRLKGNILDLGCGTGAVAEALHNDDIQFDGVDISEKMLDVAQKKGFYRKLVKSDLESFLQKNPPHYDMVLAFDVFCYTGSLENILKSLKSQEVWFSVETADDDRHGDYYLMPNGRYKHKKSYIERLSKEIGFDKIEAFELVLRTENNENVHGLLFHVV